MDRITYNIYKTPEGGATIKKADAVDGEAIGSIIYAEKELADVLPLLFFMTITLTNELKNPIRSEIRIGK